MLTQTIQVSSACATLGYSSFSNAAFSVCDFFLSFTVSVRVGNIREQVKKSLFLSCFIFSSLVLVFVANMFETHI